MVTPGMNPGFRSTKGTSLGAGGSGSPAEPPYAGDENARCGSSCMVTPGMNPGFRSTKGTSLAEHLAGDEQDIRGAFGQAPDVPAVPGRSIGDQLPGGVAFLGQLFERAALDAVKHVDLDLLALDPERLPKARDAPDERHVVRAEHEAQAVSLQLRQHERAQREVVGVNVPLG